jgi:phosphopantothenoylcysteine decarboxylase/phosphopantothenate--cysteine ligase
MYEAAMEHFPASDAAILCAAVADYRPEKVSAEKIKRGNKKGMAIRLVANPDIAASLGAIKRDGQALAGFALETNDGTVHAAAKLKKKNLDFIVLNSLEDRGAGFRVDTNKITILSKNGDVDSYPLKSKQEAASDIVNKLIPLISK